MKPDRRTFKEQMDAAAEDKPHCRHRLALGQPRPRLLDNEMRCQEYERTSCRKNGKQISHCERIGRVARHSNAQWEVWVQRLMGRIDRMNQRSVHVSDKCWRPIGMKCCVCTL